MAIDARRKSRFYISTPHDPNSGRVVSVQNFIEPGNRKAAAGYQLAGTVDAYRVSEAVDSWLNNRGRFVSMEQTHKGEGADNWQRRWLVSYVIL